MIHRYSAAAFKKDVRDTCPLDISLMRGCSIITSRAVSIPVHNRLARSDFRYTEISGKLAFASRETFGMQLK